MTPPLTKLLIRRKRMLKLYLMMGVRRLPYLIVMSRPPAKPVMLKR